MSHYYWLLLTLLTATVGTCSVSVQSIVDSIKGNCVVVHIMGNVVSLRHDNVNYVTEKWGAETLGHKMLRYRAIQKSGVYCKWIIFDHIDPSIIITEWSLDIAYSNIIVISENLPSEPPYPLDHALRVLYVVEADGLRKPVFYANDVLGNHFVKLSVPVFLKRDSFDGKPLVWVYRKRYPIPLNEFQQYRETRGNIHDLFGSMKDIMLAVNATPGFRIFPTYPRPEELRLWHVCPTGALTVLSVSSGIPLPVGVWDGVGFFVRKPHTLTPSLRVPLLALGGNPIVTALCLLSSLIISCTVFLSCRVGSGQTPVTSIFRRAFLIFVIGFGQPLTCCKFLYLNKKESNAARLAIAGYLLGAVILISVRQTEYVSNLLVADVHHPPRTFPTLFTSDYSLPYYGVPNTMVKGFITPMVLHGNKLVYQTKLRMEKGPGPMTMPKCVVRVVTKEKEACLGPILLGKAYGEYFIGGNMAGLFFDSSQDKLGSFPLAMTINRRMINIKGVVRKVLLSLLESGLNQYRRSRTSERRVANGKKSRNDTFSQELYSPSTGEKPNIIGFTILIIGMLIVPASLFLLETVTVLRRKTLIRKFR